MIRGICQFLPALHQGNQFSCPPSPPFIGPMQPRELLRPSSQVSSWLLSSGSPIQTIRHKSGCITLGVGAILSQCTVIDQKLHPWTCFTHCLTAAERNYNIGNKGFLTVKLSWRSGATGWRVPRYLFWYGLIIIIWCAFTQPKRLNSWQAGRCSSTDISPCPIGPVPTMPKPILFPVNFPRTLMKNLNPPPLSQPPTSLCQSEIEEAIRVTI